MSSRRDQAIKNSEQYLANTYGHQNLVIAEGRGSSLFDADQREYIDFSSGIGCLSLGHGHSKIANAAKNQIDRITHASNLYYTEPQAELAKNLCKATGFQKVFLSNSGAEANECALKAARALHYEKTIQKLGEERKYKPGCVMTLEGSFHGRTMATISMTGQEKYHPEKFAPYLGNVITRRADFNEIDDAVVYNDVYAIVLEVIQGEGGVVPMEKDLMQKIQKLCDKEDILLVVDEVQTGNGRTGKYFAYEHYDLHPNIVVTAKGLGGGFPIGATLFDERTAGALKPGDHGSTFGGNPLSCAAANVVVESITAQGFMDSVAQKGELMRAKLEEIPGITDVSGIGLMVGAGLDEGLSAKEIQKECLKNGLVILTAGENRLRFLPALNIADDAIRCGIKSLEKSMTR